MTIQTYANYTNVKVINQRIVSHNALVLQLHLAYINIMPIYKTWNNINPKFISFVLDFFLENQSDIRSDHDWDSDSLHKWEVSTLSHSIGYITLEPDSDTGTETAGTIYGYLQSENTQKTDFDYHPKLMQLVRDGGNFINYCHQRNILTEISDMDDYSSLRDINGLIRTAYHNFNNDLLANRSNTNDQNL